MPQAVDINSILSLLAGNAQQAQGNAQSFADMLKQRREFVQGAENGVVDQAQGAIQNGSNGVPVSPAALNTPALNYHTDEANKTAGLTQQAFGYQNQATDILKSLAQIGSESANRGLQQQQIDLQKRGQDLQYGLDTTGGGTSGVDAVNAVIKSGGADLLKQATTDAERFKIAKDIVAAGGVGNYRKSASNPMSDQEKTQLQGTNATLQSITRIEKQLSTSKALQSVLNNPVKKSLASVAIGMGHQEALKTLGLSPDDIAALGDLTSLNAQGERQLVGGKLSGYLSDKLSPSQPGLSKDAEGNKTQVAILKKNILNSLNTYAKQKGYNSSNDIPGIDHPTHSSGSVMLKAPDGKTYKVDAAEAPDALKNGWKVVQ